MEPLVSARAMHTVMKMGDVSMVQWMVPGCLGDANSTALGCIEDESAMKIERPENYGGGSMEFGICSVHYLGGFMDDLVDYTKVFSALLCVCPVAYASRWLPDN